MAAITVPRSSAESVARRSISRARVAPAAASSTVRPSGVIPRIIRRRSSGALARVSRPRSTSRLTSLEVEGSVRPRCSATSDSEAPGVPADKEQGAELRHRQVRRAVTAHLGADQPHHQGDRSP
ncbi:MAG: hypothetical protein KatS3mg051_0760 [Anaerolineae bacterium]|nr:MAG: hypothetical protein KatS3mg051_0760 [Anaerolineae bacterium]